MEEFKEMGVPEQLYRISAKQQQVNFMILPVYQSTDNDGVAEPVMGVASATQMLDAQVLGGETAVDATMGAVASDKKDEGTDATWKPYEQYACGLVRHNTRQLCDFPWYSPNDRSVSKTAFVSRLLGCPRKLGSMVSKWVKTYL